MRIAIGCLLIAVAFFWRWMDFAIAVAPGWHVSVWMLPGLIGLALIASTIRRWG